MGNYFGKKLLLMTVGLLLTGCASRTAYLDSSLPAEDRARSLVSQMTLEEKIGQMTQVERKFIKPVDIGTYYIGSVLSGGGSSPTPNTVQAWREMVDEMQIQALSTRLGIPMIYGSDAVHGHGNLRGAVLFPHHIGLGAANNPDLVREIARITAIEAAATGVKWNFNPCLAVPQDIRWGRTYEGFSSDPEIVSVLGKAETLGLQDFWNQDAAMLACLKHYVADGGTLGGKDRGDFQGSDQELRDVHLYPYLASIEAGAGSVMASYSSIDGLKMHSHKELITDVLKGEHAFQGFVVSDWAAVKQLPGNGQAQVTAAINAGIDMVMVPDNYKIFIKDLAAAVNTGDVSMKRIDDAVFRILKTKFEMGLFERPYTEQMLELKVGSPEHRAIGRQAVAESQVLLKNEGILPLSAGKKILVYGSKIDNIGIQSGGWSITWQGSPAADNVGDTILDGIREYAGEENITFVKTAKEVESLDLTAFDLLIVADGEMPYAETTGDRPRPALPPSAKKVLQWAEVGGLPSLLMIISGRPLLLDGAEEIADAIVASWQPGTEGKGVADVLFGIVPFSGKLSFSWPKDESGLVQGLEESKYLFPLGYGLVLE